MKEIIEELNNLKILQKSMDFLEDLPEEVVDKYFEDYVTEGLEVDKHRWYETSLSVYKVEQGLIGVVSVTDLFSESSEVEDIFYTLQFHEVAEVPSITYKIIK